MKSVRKDYKIHPTRKTKKLLGKTYPNCIKNENKDEIKVLHDFLSKYTKSVKKASAMIKKNYKRVKETIRDSTKMTDSYNGDMMLWRK